MTRANAFKEELLELLKKYDASLMVKDTEKYPIIEAYSRDVWNENVKVRDAIRIDFDDCIGYSIGQLTEVSDPKSTVVEEANNQSTLRDQMALAILQCYLSNGGWNYGSYHHHASCAYAQADAMLKVRNERN